MKLAYHRLQGLRKDQRLRNEIVPLDPDMVVCGDIFFKVYVNQPLPQKICDSEKMIEITLIMKSCGSEKMIEMTMVMKLAYHICQCLRNDQRLPGLPNEIVPLDSDLVVCGDIFFKIYVNQPLPQQICDSEQKSEIAMMRVS